MRSILFFGIAATLLLASCEEAFEPDFGNEANGPTEVFSATTETEVSTRTSLSRETNGDGCHSLYWNSGDAISISDGINTTVYITDDSNTSSADFVRSDGRISNTAARYEAFYPSSITTTNMVLPANQNYIDGNIENFPMRAVSTNKNLAFKNLCGIIRFCLKSEENGQMTVSSISLSSDKGMSGAFTVGEDDAAVITSTDGVVLTCADAEQLYATSTTDFNIIVPQGEYNPLKVKICDGEGNELNLVSEGVISVKRSEITRITLTLAKSKFETSLESIPVIDSNVDFTER